MCCFLLIPPPKHTQCSQRTLLPTAAPPQHTHKHSQVRFSVPKEAVQLDFVFSNVQSGEGIYDNRGGFDYHLPIEGGTGAQFVLLSPWYL